MTTLFYTKMSRVSRVQAITDTGTVDGKKDRTGEVPTLDGMYYISNTFFFFSVPGRYLLFYMWSFSQGGSHIVNLSFASNPN